MGNNLFNELRKYFSLSWGALPIEFTIKLSQNFEDGMEEIFNSNISTSIPSLMRQMAKYLCQFRINSYSNSLYFRFLGYFNSSTNDIVFSTLNYDLLLEYAASAKGLIINYFSEHQPQADEIFIWKLHGSCNFIPTTIQLDSKTLFESRIGFDTGLKGVDSSDAINFCNSATGLYPAMCLYMKSKHTQIGHSQIRAIQTRWKEKVLDANKVLIVGVKPYFYDKHIWEPLTETDAKIGFIGSSEGYKNWLTNHGRSQTMTELIGQRWDICFDDTIKFLKS